MIDDHLMPSGEPVPTPTRRDRSLEALGGSTRLELGLGGVMRLLRRRGLLLLGIFAIAFALIYAGSSQLPKRYSSVAWIKVKDPSQNLFIKSGITVDLTKEQRAAILTLESPRLRAALQKSVGAKFNDIQDVSATGLEASPLIRVDTTASTPELAEKTANIVAQFAVGDRTTKAQKVLLTAAGVQQKSADELVSKVTDLSRQLQGMPTTNAAYAQLSARLDSATAALRDASTQADTSRTQAGVVDGGMAIYEDATLPVDPDFPKPLSWSIIGGLALLLISIAVVYGREELAGRFRSGDASESRRAGTRVLGVVPTANGSIPRGVVTGAATTIDEVGLQLVHLLGRGKPNVVVLCGVDGPAPEGAARHLAQAIAESGARVVYAGCRGVAYSADDDAFEAPVPRARLSVVHEQQTGGRMRVLDDGISIGELTVARARTIMRRLTEQCEYVVIAAPSPTIEPATLVLAELADATVMVAEHGVTKLRDAERAATRLRRVGGAVLGVIVDPARPGPISATFVPRTAGATAG